MIRNAIVATLILSLSLIPSAQAIKVIPPKISELEGNWLGQSDNGEFARLQFANDGRGMLALNYYPKNPVWLYRVVIKRSDPLSYDLEFKLTPIDSAPRLTLTDASASRHIINFQVESDPFNGVYALTPEIEALERINRLIKTHSERR